jgi:hypothetical protein
LRPSLSAAYGKASEIVIDHLPVFLGLSAAGWVVSLMPALAARAGATARIIAWPVHLVAFLALQCAILVAARRAFEKRPLSLDTITSATIDRFPRFFGVTALLTIGGVAAVLMATSGLLGYLVTFLMQAGGAVLDQAGVDKDLLAKAHELVESFGGTPGGVWIGLGVLGVVALYWIGKVWYLAWLVPVMEDDRTRGAFRTSRSLMRGRVVFLTVALLSMMGLAIVPFGLAALIEALAPAPFGEPAGGIVLELLYTYILVLHVAVYAQLRATAGAAAAASTAVAAPPAAGAPIVPR